MGVAIREATTSEISPDKVFQMGEEDLSRINNELQAIGEKG